MNIVAKQTFMRNLIKLGVKQYLFLLVKSLTEIHQQCLDALGLITLSVLAQHQRRSEADEE